MLTSKLQALFHPEQYHGWGKRKKFFEGWYYKIINANESKAYAIIPGIAMDERGKRQAFIQVLDGKKLTAGYHKFDAAQFEATKGKFEIEIGASYFSAHSMRLQLPEMRGELRFRNQVPWPSSWYSPGIMGPFSFVPFMECYHGILSMDHEIEGELIVSDEAIDFSGGRGYMEKDWGRSFPSAYIWLQSNHFSQPGISIKSSIAKIPWLTGSFVGFIAGLWVQDRLYEFTTYNFTRLRKSLADRQKVEIVMENGRYRLEIFAHRQASTALASPVLGFMDGRIEESMTAHLEVQLKDLSNGQILFSDTGRNAGLEVAGKVEEITIGYSN